MDRRSSRTLGMSPETLDQPGAEQRYRGVAEGFGMCNQVIAIAIIQRRIERPDEAALPKVLGEQQRIAQSNTLSTQRILDSEHGGIKHQTALIFDIGDAVLADKL